MDQHFRGGRCITCAMMRHASDHVRQPGNVMCSIVMDDDDRVLCPSL